MWNHWILENLIESESRTFKKGPQNTNLTLEECLQSRVELQGAKALQKAADLKRTSYKREGSCDQG